MRGSARLCCHWWYVLTYFLMFKLSNAAVLQPVLFPGCQPHVSCLWYGQQTHFRDPKTGPLASVAVVLSTLASLSGTQRPRSTLLQLSLGTKHWRPFVLCHLFKLTALSCRYIKPLILKGILRGTSKSDEQGMTMGLSVGQPVSFVVVCCWSYSELRHRKYSQHLTFIAQRIIFFKIKLLTAAFFNDKLQENSNICALCALEVEFCAICLFGRYHSLKHLVVGKKILMWIDFFFF